MSDQANIVTLNILRLSSLTSDAIERLWAEASEVRRQKAARYVRKEDALRCLASEALLRRTLRLCGWDDTVSPQIGAQGKPYVDAADFYYNISHGGDCVVIAYGSTELGVDVEVIEAGRHREAVARKHFTSTEQSLLFDDTANETERASRFTLLWTRKESYVKYTGQGLTGKLPTFSVDAMLPRGEVLDVTGVPLDVVTESFFPDETHIVSVCGKFDALRVDDVTEQELFEKI